MVDARDEFIIKVCSNFDSDTASSVLHIYDSVMCKYEKPSPKCTSVVPVSDMESTVKILQLFYASKKIEGQSLAALKNKMYTYNNFFRITGKPIDKITKDDCRDFLNRYQAERKCSDRTLDRYRSQLSSLFTWCYAEEYIPKNPMVAIKSIKYVAAHKPGLSRMEIANLKNGNFDLREKALVEMLLSSGCRISEILNVRIDQVNWASNRVEVLGKGKKKRTVKFSDDAHVLLQRYLKSRSDDCPYLFVTKRRPYRQLKSDVEGRWFRDVKYEIVMESGKPFTAHSLRHTYATNMTLRGAPLQTVSKALGHADVNTTIQYLDLADCIRDVDYEKYVG